MEYFTLNTIVAYAKQHGFKRIIGEYIPTSKNGMVAEHYDRLGFTPMVTSDRKRYELYVDSYAPKECYITNK
jgi:predicted enzyme involved in methoxymalonyl-ACP biosynthesis